MLQQLSLLNHFTLFGDVNLLWQVLVNQHLCILHIGGGSSQFTAYTHYWPCFFRHFTLFLDTQIMIQCSSVRKCNMKHCWILRFIFLNWVFFSRIYMFVTHSYECLNTYTYKYHIYKYHIHTLRSINTYVHKKAHI